MVVQAAEKVPCTRSNNHGLRLTSPFTLNEVNMGRYDKLVRNTRTDTKQMTIAIAKKDGTEAPAGNSKSTKTELNNEIARKRPNIVASTSVERDVAE